MSDETVVVEHILSDLSALTSDIGTGSDTGNCSEDTPVHQSHEEDEAGCPVSHDYSEECEEIVTNVLITPCTGSRIGTDGGRPLKCGADVVDGR